MKKILVAFIVCTVLLAMTGVVSATNGGDYCKVTGGGILYDSCNDGEKITVGFTGQGYYNTDDVKGKVNIVFHESKTKLHMDVKNIQCCWCEDCCCDACLYMEDGDDKYLLCVKDLGEGKGPHGRVCLSKYIDADTTDSIVVTETIFCGELNGNVQVHFK